MRGRSFRSSFTAQPNLSTNFVWDGADAYGRTVQGAQTATVTLGYIYDVAYTYPAPLSQSFGVAGGRSLGITRTVQDGAAFRRIWTVPMGQMSMQSTGWPATRPAPFNPSRAR